MAQRAKLESSAANQATQRDLDNQHVADAVERHLQRQFAEALQHAQSQAENSLHACRSYQMQLKDAEDKLKMAEEKLKDTEDKMKEFQIQTQQAVDDFVVETRTRGDEL